MSNKQRRLEHARHNYEVCQHLNGSGFNDWVVTTAFYSALHFIRFAVFPFSKQVAGEERVYHKFSDYTEDAQGTKHAQHADLASKHVPDAYDAYQRLMSFCMTARYHDYQTSDPIKNRALEDLEIVKAACEDRAREDT